ncbi:serine/threonine-protein kinase [Actinophytocola sediminis]
MTALRPGDPGRIGDYTTLSRLGNGAMGTVFLARSPGGRLVAVKVIRAELADDDGFRERFRQEVAAMRAVGGFWTAAVVDADPDAAVPWLATEYVAGPTLKDAVATHGPLSPAQARALAAGLAEALRVVHKTGLVHRDLKPANVLLAGDGPRVIDFGIARTLEGTGLTATGMIVGTPSFLSPEQLDGREITPASDVFALGAVLVYATTGDGPFGTGTLPALVYRVVHGEPNLDRVPAELRHLVARCLDRDPAARPTPTELLTELSAGGHAHWAPPPAAEVAQPATPPVTEVARPTTPRTPTRAYSATPSGEGPVVFRVRGRPWAAVSFLVLAPCALLFTAMGAPVFWSQDAVGIALFSLILLLFAVPAVRNFWRLVRPRRWLEVSRTGLTLGHGRRQHALGWSEIARARVVAHKKRPWLVVSLPAGVSRAGLGAEANGGLRAFPVAHDVGYRTRERELADLRAALSWYGPTVYDPSP